MDGSPKFELDDFAFVGRTFEEYLRMFDLTPELLADRTVLDCPSGPGSFVATAHKREIPVIGVDRLYTQSHDALADRCRADFDRVVAELEATEDQFDWGFYGNLAGRINHLRQAYRTFLDDYPAGRQAGRYVPAELPDLPLETDSVSLVLSAHLLFLYGDRLDYEFHLSALRELLRVATDEVRVFPLVSLDFTRYSRLDDLRADLAADGYRSETVDVPFEFQRGATEMLVVSVPQDHE